MAAKFAKWRAALQTLNGVLDDVALKETPGNLLEAKLELASTLATLTGFVRSRGCDELIERMVLAGKNAAPDAKVSDIYKLLASLSVQLRVRVRRARANSVGASASGDWCVCGKSYSVKATITEKDGDCSGSIVVDGLGFTAEGSFAAGKGKLDGTDEEVKTWISESGVNMTTKDATHVVAVGLEILTKEKVKGVADVDVPEVVFGLLRGTLGLPSLDQLENSAEISPEDAVGQESNDDEDSNDGEESDEAGEEMHDVDDVEIEREPLVKHREEWKVVVEGDEEGKDDDQGNNRAMSIGSCVEVIKSFNLTGEGTRLQKGWKGIVEEIDGDGNAFIGFCDGRKGEWVSPEDFDELSKLEPEKGHEEKDAAKREEAEADVAEDDDVAEETLFVSQRAMASIKGKLAKAVVPTQADISKLLDTTTFAEEEELVSLDLSILGIPSPDTLSSKQAVAQWTAAFVKKHGLKRAAELCVKAELDEEKEDDEEEGEEEEEEEDEEEKQEDAKIEEEAKRNDKVSLGGVANKIKVEESKRLIMDEEEARKEPARKRVRATAGA